MIDYDLTIKNFFDSVDAYLGNYMKRSYDTLEYRAIDVNRQKIRNIAVNPRAYTNRFSLTNNISVKFDESGFVRAGSPNCDVYRAFTKAIVAINNYYAAGENPPMKVRKQLLGAIKNWTCKTSPNVFKDIIYFFSPLQSFATHVTTQKKR